MNLEEIIIKAGNDYNMQVSVSEARVTETQNCFRIGNYFFPKQRFDADCKQLFLCEITPTNAYGYGVGQPNKRVFCRHLKTHACRNLAVMDFKKGKPRGYIIEGSEFGAE